MAEMRNSLVVSADFSALVTAARQGAGALDTVSQSADRTSASFRNVLAQASPQSFEALSSAALRTSTAFGEVRSSLTAMGAVQGSIDGLSVSARDQVSAMMAARQEAEAWQAQLNQLRAQFDPLFAASQRYEAALQDIAEAERIGALSAVQAGAARERATSLIAVSANSVSASTTRMFASVGGGGMVMRNLAFQLNQIGQQGAVTGNYLGALSIQLPDILAAFGTWGVLIGGVTAVAGPMAIELLKGAAAGKSLNTVISELEESSSGVKSALNDARKSLLDLREEFGPAADDARELNLALLDLAQLKAEQALRAGLDKIGDNISDLATFGVTNIRTLQKQFNLTEDGAFRVGAAMQKFSAATGVEDQTAAAAGLVDAFRKAEYGADGASIKALEFAQSAGTAAVEALRLQGYSKQAAKLQEQLAKGNFAAPYTSAADEAKRLAEHTAAVLKDTASAAKMRRELETQAELNAAIVAHGRDSLEVKRLQIEAARAEYAESLKTLKVNDDIKAALMAQWELTNGLQSADPFGTAAAARQMLETRAQSLAHLRLEAQLIGQNEATRRRVLALYQAELEIRQKNIAPNSVIAQQIREGALAEAELTAQVKRQSAAWDEVSTAAEDAIDKILDADFEGALASIADEFKKLAIANPLKNALLGTEYGTLADAGGVGGIWQRLTGKTLAIDPARTAAAAASQAVATMNVTAASVTIGGAGVTSLVAASSANLNGAPVSLAGSGAVQSQIWNFFAGKGLQPHQVAAIMGNVSGESGFNPLATGDGGTSFGLFQHHASRADGLLASLGGIGGLGNVQGQLDYVWQELLGSHSGALAALRNAPDVTSATNVWMRQFEKPSTAAMQQSWPDRLGAAEAALAKFSTATLTSTKDLGTLGQGFDLFGNALSSLGQGGGGGEGGFSIIKLIGSTLGIPGWSEGGGTGGSDPKRVAGVVHEKEFVFDARATARIGVANLEAMRRGTLRGYEVGGYVSPAASYPWLSQSSGAGAVSVDARPMINIVNQSSAQITGEVTETTDARGQRQYQLVMSDAVSTGLSAPGGQARRTLRDRYGVTPTGRAR